MSPARKAAELAHPIFTRQGWKWTGWEGWPHVPSVDELESEFADLELVDGGTRRGRLRTDTTVWSTSGKRVVAYSVELAYGGDLAPAYESQDPPVRPEPVDPRIAHLEDAYDRLRAELEVTRMKLAHYRDRARTAQLVAL